MVSGILVAVPLSAIFDILIQYFDDKCIKKNFENIIRCLYKSVSKVFLG